MNWIMFYLLAGLELVSGCSEQAKTIELVFPDGFTGIAIIRSRRAEGMDALGINGVIRLEFTKSGLLDIKGELPTLNWHVLTASYAGGKQIPVTGPQQNIGNETVALRSLGLKNNVECWYLLGTAKDLGPAMAKKNGFEFPFHTKEQD